MLGARQYAAFTKAIKASTATWKVIVNEVADPAVLRAARTTAGRATRPSATKLLRFLQANVKNVLFLATDTHANLVNEVRLKHVRARPARSAPASGR